MCSARTIDVRVAWTGSRTAHQIAHDAMFGSHSHVIVSIEYVAAILDACYAYFGHALRWELGKRVG